MFGKKMSKNWNITFYQYLKVKKLRKGIGLKRIINKIEEYKILIKAKKHNKIEYNLLLIEKELWQMRKHEKIMMKVIDKLRKQIN